MSEFSCWYRFFFCSGFSSTNIFWSRILCFTQKRTLTQNSSSIPNVLLFLFLNFFRNLLVVVSIIYQIVMKYVEDHLIGFKNCQQYVLDKHVVAEKKGALVAEFYTKKKHQHLRKKAAQKMTYKTKQQTIIGLYSRNKLNLFFQNHRNEKIVRRYILVWFWDLF